MLQEEWIRKLVHMRAVQIYRAIEEGTELPDVGPDEIGWMAIELIHLMTAGDWLEASRAA